jgi:hypothetical protein
MTDLRLGRELLDVVGRCVASGTVPLWIANTPHPRSQILGDDPELSQRRRLAFRIVSSNRKPKAMIDVIVDQRLFGVVDRVLDRLQLLSKLEAGPPAFDHVDDRLKMPFRAPEATDDLGMVLVLHGLFPVLGRILVPP